MPAPAQSNRFAFLWDQLAALGVAEGALRLSSHLAALLLIGLVLAGASWIIQPLSQSADETRSQTSLAGELPAESAAVLAEPVILNVGAGGMLPDLPPLPESASAAGIARLASMHTIIPTRPRTDVITYTVQAGDTVFGIAEQFSLKPETILWGNYATLADDPHRLRPDQVLNILPGDGTYYEWQAGDGLNGVAAFYGVDPQTIIDWTGNGLDPATLGDLSNPNIEAGTWLFVPGGAREFVSWSAPIIPRSDPAVAKVLGPGNCGTILSGPMGGGTFVWPAVNRYLSGYDYAPAANHYGIDVDGDLGHAIYASDAGVVVYAGWNNWGYGNMIVIDHGNGWQTLYAHLNTYDVGCGSAVSQGQVIAAMGSTGNSSGPHLHFELMHAQYGKVNPWDFLR